MNNKNTWRHHPEECPLCKGDIVIQSTANLDDNWGHDGDPVICTNCLTRGRWTIFTGVDPFPDMYERIEARK